MSMYGDVRDAAWWFARYPDIPRWMADAFETFGPTAKEIADDYDRIETDRERRAAGHRR
jgi:hypothetical protein